MTLLTDDFTGANGSALNAAKWATGDTGAGASALIQGNRGRWKTGTSGGYAGGARISRRALVASLPDIEVTGTYTPTGETYPEVYVRATDTVFDTHSGYALRLPTQGGVAGPRVIRYVNYSGTTLGSATFAATSGTTYGFRFLVTGSTLKARVWNTSGAEPGTWNVEVTDTTITAGGYVALSIGAGNTAANYVDFDDITILDASTPIAKTSTDTLTLADLEVPAGLVVTDPTAETLTLGDTTGSTAIAIANEVYDAGIHAAGIPVTAGQVYTASVWARVSLANALRAQLVWLDAGSAVLSTTDGTDTTASAGQWTRLATTGTAPASSATLTVRIETAPTGEPFLSGQTFDADGLLVTLGPTAWLLTEADSQGFTVTRAGNDVVKSHPAGQELALAEPWYWLARPAGGGDFLLPENVPPPPLPDGGGGGGSGSTHPTTITISTGGGGGGGSTGYRSTLPWALGCFGNEVGSSASGKVDAFSAMAGVALDFVDQHPDWDAIDGGDWWYAPHVNRGYNISVSVPLYSGSVDSNISSKWATAAQHLKDNGWSAPYWRIGVEYNLNNSWRATDSNYTTWMTRYREAVNAIRGVLPDSKFVLCMNEGNPQSCSPSTSDAIVNGLCGTGHVDMIGPDYYDQWEPIRTTSEATSRFGNGSQHGTMNYWLARAKALGVKFAIPEWGVSSGSQWAGHVGGDNPFYMNYLMDWLYANRDTVEFVCYFEEPASYLRSDITTGGTNPQARAAFQAKVTQFKGQTGGGGGGGITTTHEYPLSGQNPGTTGGWGGDSGQPGGRGTDMVIGYSYPATVTVTNQFGVEVIVTAGGTVTAVNDRQPSGSLTGTTIPAQGAGYVLSGTGAGRDWLLQYAGVGAVVQLTGASSDYTGGGSGGGDGGGGGGGGGGTGTYPIKVAADGNHLEYQDGTPFLYCADTAWVTLSALTVADAKRYIDIKAGQGFNALQCSLTAFNRTSSEHRRGMPFEGGDVASPNQAYWTGIDELVAYLESKGMVAVLWPIWGASNGSWAEGTSPSTSAMATYCTWLGNRYRQQGNIMWALGGDEQYNGDSEAPARTGFWDAAAAALEAADPNHLKTFHPRWDNYNLNGAAWLDWNSIQRNDNNPPYTYTLAQTGYGYSKPFLNSEPPYWPSTAGGNTTSRKRNRLNGIWTILGGAMGVVYGGSRYGGWHIGADGNFAWNETADPTGNDTGNIKRILTQFHWERLVPTWDASVITSSRSSGTTFVAAGRASDGSLIVANTPNGAAVTVALTQLAAAGTAYWYDPASGLVSGSGQSVTNSGSQTFTPPGNNAAGDNDWILVVTTTAGRV